MTYIDPKEYKEECLNDTNKKHLFWYDEGVADLMGFAFGEEVRNNATVIHGVDEYGGFANIAIINIGSRESFSEWLSKSMSWYIKKQRQEWIVHWLDQQAEDMENE